MEPCFLYGWRFVLQSGHSLLRMKAWMPAPTLFCSSLSVLFAMAFPSWATSGHRCCKDTEKYAFCFIDWWKCNKKMRVGDMCFVNFYYQKTYLWNLQTREISCADCAFNSLVLLFLHTEYDLFTPIAGPFALWKLSLRCARTDVLPCERSAIASKISAQFILFAWCL